MLPSFHCGSCRTTPKQTQCVHWGHPKHGCGTLMSTADGGYWSSLCPLLRQGLLSFQMLGIYMQLQFILRSQRLGLSMVSQQTQPVCGSGTWRTNVVVYLSPLTIIIMHCLRITMNLVNAMHGPHWVGPCVGLNCWLYTCFQSSLWNWPPSTK